MAGGVGGGMRNAVNEESTPMGVEGNDRMSQQPLTRHSPVGRGANVPGSRILILSSHHRNTHTPSHKSEQLQ